MEYLFKQWSPEERKRRRRVTFVGLGVLGIVYALVTLTLILVEPIFTPETQFELTRRMGQRATGMIERIQSHSEDNYRVYVSFFIGEQRYYRTTEIVVRDAELTVLRQVTVLYLPDQVREVFVEDYGDPERTPKDNTASFLNALLYGFVGALLVYFFGIRPSSHPETNYAHAD